MQRIMRLMADKKASDVYLSAHSPVLIKINGLALPINNQMLPVNAPLQLLAEVLPSHRIDELKQTGELNMALSVEGVGNFRISGFRQRGSYAAVIRYIPSEVPALENLNVPPILAELIMEKRGLLLMAGEAGAGKSTTLAAMIDHRNASVMGHILTIEDPVEYSFINKKSVINQRELGSDTSSMQVALKNALHQAPDVIFMGEIHNHESMSAAITLAQTGHLCVATLQASNSAQALNRMLGFYPVQMRDSLNIDLASCLKAIVSQRLVRTQNGLSTPVVEVMLNTPLISELIGKGNFSGIPEAMQQSTSQGSQTFEQDIAKLITNGLITRKEGLANADSANNLMWRIENNVHAEVKAPEVIDDDLDDKPSFTEIILDVKHS